MPTITVNGVGIEMRKGTGTGWVFALHNGQEFGPFVDYAQAEIAMRSVVQTIEQRHAGIVTQPAA